MTAPMVEVMSEPDTDFWLWCCYTCGLERADYPSLLAAERDADEHDCRERVA